MTPRVPTRVLVAAAVTSLALLGTACDRPATRAISRTGAVGSGPADPNLVPLENVVDETGKSEVTVEVIDNDYQPTVVRVSPGTKVTWVNRGFNLHNVTPNVAGAFEAIPTGQLDPEQSASRTFAAEGTFGYYCTIHGSPTKGQRGALVVGA